MTPEEAVTVIARTVIADLIRDYATNSSGRAA